MKIGVFDSGIGGITVLSELSQSLSEFGDDTQFVYLGDTAHLPYGAKSPSQIEKLSADCARMLKDRGVEALVVACNTASSLALPVIQSVMCSIPVIGVVEPGIEAALEAKATLPSDAPVLVLATRATVKSHAYGSSLRTRLAQGPDSVQGTQIFEKACPLLVPMIEEGWIDHSILHQTIAEYVKPYLAEGKPGVALLGCTHYPWIHAAFERALPGWTVVNSARAVSRNLQGSSWFRVSSSTPKSSEKRIEWIFTDPEAVPDFARQFIQKT